VKEKDRYLILETTTGYMDGFYGHPDTAVEALNSWKLRRPKEQHVVLVSPVHFEIPEDMLLADHQYGIVRGEVHV
jgi:hypothetical protein